MAIARARKEEWVASFRQDLAEAPFVLVAAPKGLNAGEVSGLRRTLRQGGGGYRVVRNRLAALALKDTANEPLIELLDAGERAVAYAGEGAALSKACAQYAKEWEERFVIVGGMMDGSRISAGEVKALAELPPLTRSVPSSSGSWRRLLLSLRAPSMSPPRASLVLPPQGCGGVSRSARREIAIATNATPQRTQQPKRNERSNPQHRNERSNPQHRNERSNAKPPLSQCSGIATNATFSTTANLTHRNLLNPATNRNDRHGRSRHTGGLPLQTQRFGGRRARQEA